MADVPTPATAAAPAFRRVLGPWAAGSLVVGTMIGTGIFAFVSEVAGLLPSPAVVLLAWALGAVVAGCGALCLAELAAAYPQTGGIYVYLARAFGPYVAFLYGWCKFGIMRVASFAIPALLFAGFAAEFVGLAPERALEVRVPLAVATVVALTAVNVAGVRAGGLVQVVLTTLKVAALLGILVVAAGFALGWLAPHPLTSALAPAARPSSGASPWLALGIAMIPVMWTYGGWDESPFVAEEVRDPERNLPLSILGGLAVVSVLFVAANAAYLAVLSQAEMAASGELTASVTLERALGPSARRAMAGVLMVSTFGAANGMALTGARIAYAAGRDQPGLAWLGTVGAHTRTPVRGLVAQAVLACTAIWLLEDPMVLLYFTGLAYWLFAGAMVLALVVLRRREPDRPRPFRVWAYPVTPAIFAVAALAMCTSVAVQWPSNAVATLAILAAGSFAYLLQRFVPRP